VAELDEPPGTQLNDGKADPQGRFWAGTKHLEGEHAIGSLYRLGRDGRAVRVLDGLTVSNGLGWSPDGATMYHVDSPTRRVDAYAFDPATGAVEGRRELVSFPPDAGLPDGLTVDEDGHLWVAFWGGGALRRVAPDGRVVEEIAMPASLVTSCAFGGEDGGDLFVTSARVGLTDAELRDRPLAGAVFRLRPGVRGPAGIPFDDGPDA
jgi:sugar lactone lactonase YvrE